MRFAALVLLSLALQGLQDAPGSKISPCLDYCACLEDPAGCREVCPDVYSEMFGPDSLDTEAILELWSCD